MYDNNFDSFENNEKNTSEEEAIKEMQTAETADTVQEEMESSEAIVQEETEDVSSDTDTTAHDAEILSQSEGVFSGCQAADDTSEKENVQSAELPFSAKDIQPRKKTGLGKKIAVLCLSGLLFGTCAAGAYCGVTYVASHMLVSSTTTTESSETVVKEDIQVKHVETSTEAVVSDWNKTGTAWDVSDVVEQVMPAMVSIVNNYTETYSTIFGQSYTQHSSSSGSGIIIGQNDTELIVASNYHVISGSEEIILTFSDGATATAYVKGTNPDMDLAVVAVPLESMTTETLESIAIAKLGDSDSLKLGQPVIAIGNALGYGQSVTTGVVSAVDREITLENDNTGKFIQTDAAINPGNSGGALLNMNGEVIGINSNKIGGSTVEGMGYAIPISAAEPIISDLSLQSTKMKVEEADRGYVGISIREVSASMAQTYGMPQGVYITDILEDSAAQKAGLQVHDIIVKLDTFEVESYADLQDALQYFAAGTTVQVEVMRIQDNQYQSVVLDMTLGTKPVSE